MAAASIDDATGVIRTTSAFAADRPTPKKAPAAAHAEEDDGPLSQSHVAMLWTHYQTARGTLERLAGEAKGTGGLDVHSPFVERALRLLEVLVLRKEKGANHFINMTLGAPVIPNNPAFDPEGDGKRRSELPPTGDVPELIARALAELEHAMRPSIRPGGRALDVSKAVKALQEGVEKARAAAPPKPAAAAIPATETKGASACCSSSSSGSCAKPTAPAAPTGAGELRQRHGHSHGHKHKHGHRHRSKGGDCCGSDGQLQQAPGQGVAALLAAALAWAKAALSGPGAVAPRIQSCGSGGGCCDTGASGPSRMGAKQDGHAFMVAVLTGFVLLPFVLWWMS